MGAQEIHPWTYGGKDVVNFGPSVLPVSDSTLPDVEPPAEDLAKIESGVLDDEPAAPAIEPEPESKPGKVPPA
jgi:hypothetical protein